MRERERDKTTELHGTYSHGARHALDDLRHSADDGRAVGLAPVEDAMLQDHHAPPHNSSRRRSAGVADAAPPAGLAASAVLRTGLGPCPVAGPSKTAAKSAGSTPGGTGCGGRMRSSCDARTRTCSSGAHNFASAAAVDVAARTRGPPGGGLPMARQQGRLRSVVLEDVGEFLVGDRRDARELGAPCGAKIAASHTNGDPPRVPAHTLPQGS